MEYLIITRSLVLSFSILLVRAGRPRPPRSSFRSARTMRSLASTWYSCQSTERRAAMTPHVKCCRSPRARTHRLTRADSWELMWLFDRDAVPRRGRKWIGFRGDECSTNQF